MSDLEDAAAVLSDAVLLDTSPQAEALGEAVARHVSTRPDAARAVDEQVPDLLRVFMRPEQIEALLEKRKERAHDD
jgi:hypothetical protein